MFKMRTEVDIYYLHQNNNNLKTNQNDKRK
jgi:hypothetical protein